MHHGSVCFPTWSDERMAAHRGTIAAHVHQVCLQPLPLLPCLHGALGGAAFCSRALARLGRALGLARGLDRKGALLEAQALQLCLGGGGRCCPLLTADSQVLHLLGQRDGHTKPNCDNKFLQMNRIFFFFKSDLNCTNEFRHSLTYANRPLSY